MKECMRSHTAQKEYQVQLNRFVAIFQNEIGEIGLDGKYVGGRFEFSEFNNPKLPDRFLILIGQAMQKDCTDRLLIKSNETLESFMSRE